MALLVLEEAERFLDDLERQAEQPGQVQAEHAAARVERAQDHVVEKAERQAGLLQVLRGSWGPLVEPPPSQSRLFLICCIAASPPSSQAFRPDPKSVGLSSVENLLLTFRAGKRRPKRDAGPFRRPSEKWCTKIVVRPH